LAINPLNLTPQAQSWHLAGLCRLLCSEPVNILLPKTGSVPQNSAVKSRPQLLTSENRAEQASTAESPFFARNEISETSLPNFSRPKPVQQKSTVSQVQKHSETLNIFDTTKIPASWQEILRKVIRAPIAWTYPELGQDLLFKGDANAIKRSATLKTLINTLQLEKGSSTFWPVQLPNGADSKPEALDHSLDDTDFFCSGLDYLGVKYLIAFGADSLQGTSYAKLKLEPFVEQVQSGRFILPLPAFDLLLSDTNLLSTVSKFLHSVFTKFHKG
jgi:hypothetical protein